MKRKETKPSPVKTKKGRASLESAPTPLQATVEEQRRKAREWFEQEEERKKLPATSSASNASRSRSTTPTSKVPAKKAKKEEIEERTTRSTRNTARNGSPVRNRRKVIEEKVEDSTEGEESEEEMSAPVSAPRSRKAVAKATPEIESAPVVKTPSGKKSRASLGSAKTPTEPISVEDQRQKAKDWAAKEAEPTKAARTPKSATKTPSVATPKITPAAEARLRSESTASASSSRQASAIKGMTMPAASPLPAE